MISTSVWDGIENAEVFERGRYVTANFQGVVRVKRTIWKQTRAQGFAFIVEFDVLETNMPEEHAVGSKLTWFQKAQDRATFLSNVLGWAASCVGCPPTKQNIDALDKAQVKYALDVAVANPDANPFIGITVRLFGTPTTTRAGNPFTRYDFAPYP